MAIHDAAIAEKLILTPAAAAAAQPASEPGKHWCASTEIQAASQAITRQLSALLGCEYRGLQTAARAAKRRGLLTGTLANRLCRLDEAAHEVAHFSKQSMEALVLKVASCLQGSADHEEVGDPAQSLPATRFGISESGVDAFTQTPQTTLAAAPSFSPATAASLSDSSSALSSAGSDDGPFCCGASCGIGSVGACVLSGAAAVFEAEKAEGAVQAMKTKLEEAEVTETAAKTEAEKAEPDEQAVRIEAEKAEETEVAAETEAEKAEETEKTVKIEAEKAEATEAAVRAEAEKAEDAEQAAKTEADKAKKTEHAEAEKTPQPVQNEEEANKEDDWPWMVWYDLLPCQGTAALRRLRARRAPWAVVEPVVDATRY